MDLSPPVFCVLANKWFVYGDRKRVNRRGKSSGHYGTKIRIGGRGSLCILTVLLYSMHMREYFLRYSLPLYVIAYV